MASPYYVATTGNDTTGDGSSGNPYASLGKAVTVAIAGSAGWIIYMKKGTYTITSATANANAGRVSVTQAGTATAANKIIGYDTTINDITFENTDRQGGSLSRPVLTPSGLAAGTILLGGNQGLVHFINLDVDGAGADVCLFNGGATRITVSNCRFHNAKGDTALTICTMAGSTTHAVNCEIDSNVSTAGLGIVNCNFGNMLNCYIHDNVGIGAVATTTVFWVNVICDGMTGTGSDGVGFSVAFGGSGTITMVACRARGNASDGVKIATGTISNVRIFNLLSTDNVGYGVNTNSLGPLVWLTAPAFYNNSADYPTGGTNDPNTENLVDLSASPYTNAAGGNFSLNTTAGGGAAVRAVGRPRLTPGNSGTTISYPDVGGVQHADAGGAAGMLYVPNLEGA